MNAATIRSRSPVAVAAAAAAGLVEDAGRRDLPADLRTGLRAMAELLARYQRIDHQCKALARSFQGVKQV
jgi:hypothetical protein